MGGGDSASNKISGNAGIEGLKRAVAQSNDPRVLEAVQSYGSGGSSLADMYKSFNSNLSSRRDSNDSDARRQWIDKQKAGKVSSWKNEDLGKRAWNKDHRVATDDEYAQRAEDELGQQWIQDVANSNNEAAQNQSELNRALMQQMVYDPMTGTRMATEQVQNNELLSGMFGKGGLQDRMLAEEQDLAGRGFKLQNEDHEAYGQASDETARLFGQEEASLSNALASRGLAAAPSGAAGAGYSGLMGNKYERLAGAQRKIADDRMKMNLERLNNVRNFSMKSNQLAQAAIGDQYGRNVQGVQGQNQILKDAANAGRMEQDQENAAFDQIQATKGPGAGEIIGGVLGAGAGAFTGGLGTGIGASLGSTLGGAVDGKKTK